MRSKALARLDLGEMDIRAEDADLGDEASCAMSSDSNPSEEECPRTIRAATSVAEAAAAVVEVPITAETSQRRDLAGVLHKVQAWEQGMAPPPLFLFHHKRSHMHHYCTAGDLPQDAILLCSRRQRGAYVRGPPPKQGSVCLDCTRDSDSPHWEHRRQLFEQQVVEATHDAQERILRAAQEQEALADNEREDERFTQMWGPGRKLAEGFVPMPVLSSQAATASQLLRDAR